MKNTVGAKSLELDGLYEKGSNSAQRLIRYMYMRKKGKNWVQAFKPEEQAKL